MDNFHVLISKFPFYLFHYHENQDAILKYVPSFEWSHAAILFLKERSRAASSYGIIWGTQVKTNMVEFSAESHGVDCGGDRKVLTELQIAIRSKLLFKMTKSREN